MDRSEQRRGPTFLRNWRDFRYLSQEEAADRIGMGRSNLSKIETGALPYNQDFLETAARIYGCEPEDLLSIDPKKPDPPKLVYDRLRHADPETQQKIMEVLEILLKTA